MTKADTHGHYTNDFIFYRRSYQTRYHGVSMLTLATPFLRAVSLTLAPEPMF